MGAERVVVAAFVAMGCAGHGSRPAALATSIDASMREDAAMEAGTDARGDRAAATAYPRGLTTAGPTLFRFDTEHATFAVPVPGAAPHVLSGRLRDADGRRELFFDDVSLTAPDWHLPPVAATGSDGTTLVCFDTLYGAHSPRAAGIAPDPANGMRLTCVLRAPDGTLGTPAIAPTVLPGAWLLHVAARADGTFRVQFQGDDGLLVGPRGDGHGVYETTFRNGTFSIPVLVAPATDPTGPASTTAVTP